MSDLLTMHEGFPFSPQTHIAKTIAADAVSITVDDPNVFPDAPNEATIGSNDDGETILYTIKSGNVLSGITRGFDAKNGYGEAKAWNAGTPIACYFTNSKLVTMQENIRRTYKKALTATDHITDHIKETVASEGGVHGIRWNPGTRTHQIFNPVLEQYVDITEEPSQASAVLQTVTHNNVPLSELQALINSLPKNLTQNITINTLAGTTDTAISIVSFAGRGRLIINGATARDTPTHNLPSVVISRCTCEMVQINGLTVTSTITDTINVLDCTCRVHITNCNVVSAGNRGIRITRTSYGLVENCMVSNRTEAAVATYRSTVYVTGMSGTNNMFLYRAMQGGRLYVATEGTISLAPGGRYANTTSLSGAVYNSSNERITGALFAGAMNTRIFTVRMDELNTFVSSLPRDMLGNITINVLPGNSSTALAVSNFRGTGILTIRTVNAIGEIVLVNNNTTHNIPSLRCDDNSNSQIIISGFRLTTGENTTKVNCSRNSSSLHFTHLHITGGANQPSASGFTIDTTRTVVINNCTVSNQTLGFSADRTPLISFGTCVGVNNTTVFRARTGTIFRLTDLTYPAADAFATRQTGGDVLMPDNAVTTLLPRLDNSTDIGAASRRFRTIFAATGTINTSDANEKENIESLPDAFKDFFMLLKPSTFKYKGGDGDKNGRHVGLIAQEVQDALKQCDITEEQFAGLVVSILEDEVPAGEFEEVVVGEEEVLAEIQPMGVLLDEDGSCDPASTVEPVMVKVPIIEKMPVMKKIKVGERLGLRYSEFIPILIAMVQEQEKRIVQLEQRLQ